jgi:hypothetical protein
MSKTKEQLEAEAKAQADAEAKAKAEEEARKADEGDDSKGDNDDEGDSSSKTIDYKKLAEEEKSKREEAERLIAERKFKNKHKADDDEDDDESQDDDDKPITRKEFLQSLENERQKIRKEAQIEQAKEIAIEMADSEEEANYIIDVFQNRQFPSYLSLRDQVEEAHAIANRKIIISKNSELKRALKSKENASKDASGTQRDGQKGTSPKLSAQDESLYKRNGFAYNTTDKVWEKKLPNGKTLVKNPVTKQTYIK